jgi:hypothetical protein
MRVSGGVSRRNTPLFLANGVSPYREHLESATRRGPAGSAGHDGVLFETVGDAIGETASVRGHGYAEIFRDASTGLFVGVRRFPHDGTLEVPYAGDDATDLAHRFALDPRVALIPPRRVVLVLSGTPQKEESKQRLRELEHAGARIVRDATAEKILDTAETAGGQRRHGWAVRALHRLARFSAERRRLHPRLDLGVRITQDVAARCHDLRRGRAGAALADLHRRLP